MNRKRFLAQRLLIVPVMCLAISFVTFAMVYAAPGDVASIMAGPRANPAQIEALRERLGLNQPFIVQYGDYLSRVAHGDLGVTSSGTPVTTVIALNAPPTVLLVTASLIISLVLTLGFGLWASRRPGGLADNLIRVASTGFLGMPSFWVGIMLVLFVALPTGWFPVGGWPKDAPGQLRALVLPSLALALTVTPVLFRGLRSSLIAVTRSDYVVVGRAMGLGSGPLIRRYVMKNAATPVVPLVASMLGVLIGSTAVVEATFGLPGLGQALVNGAMQREAAVVQGITLVIGITVVLIQLIADLVLSALDPRVSLE